MFETFFDSAAAVTRHQVGPLRAERERYLSHCAAGGASLVSQRDRAFAMIRVAELMTQSDQGRIGARRLREVILARGPAVAPRTAAYLLKRVRPWFKFLGWWDHGKPAIAFKQDLDRFVTWMRDERGLTPCTIDQWRDRTATFLRWCKESGRTLGALGPEDIDAYFVTYGAPRWSRISAGHIARMLRVFLRHAASIGSCRAGLAESILSHRRYQLETLPYALDWGDVRRLIAAASGDTELDIRDRAIMLLLAVYGMREGEVAALRLEHIDREGGQLRIWRLKRSQPQLYPLVPSVAQALAEYTDVARPQVTHAEVFIRGQAPRTPLSVHGIYDIVHRRLLALQVQAAHLGPHALRHSCATKMLADGMTLKEIGDHLGHRSTASTMTYAKVDMDGLRQVGEFDLGGLQ
jgi:integrase/recombinase XerD